MIRELLTMNTQTKNIHTDLNTIFNILRLYETFRIFLRLIFSNFKASLVSIFNVYITCFLFSLLCVSPILSETKIKKEKKYSFSVTLRNGTGHFVKPLPEVELISLKQGMEIIEKKQPKSNQFRFSPLVPSNTPYLLRANYQGTSYTVLIPPVPKFWEKQHELMIYEAGAKASEIKINSAMWVTKHKEDIEVEQVYVIQNQSNPPRSFDLSSILFFVDPKAKAKKASLRYGKNSMPITLSLKEKEEYFMIERGIRPGQAEINLSFSIPTRKMKDRFLKFQDIALNEHYRILLWKPNNFKPKIIGANTKEIEIPNIGIGYQIDKKANGAKESLIEFSYDFSEGDYIIDNPLSSDSNPLFNTPLKTGVALIFLVFQGFIFLSFFRGKNLKKV